MKEARKWLEKAEEDLDTAKFNFSGKRYDVAAFFCQQAAEKALKALYILKFRRLWKIHDLMELGRKVGAPSNLLKACDALNPHYIATRYPSDVPYSENIAKHASKNAEKVLVWVRKKLTKK